MPYVKRNRLRRKRPIRRARRRPRRAYKKKSDYNYGKISTVSGIPFNLYTWMRVSSKTYPQIIPSPAIGSNPHVNTFWNSYTFAHNYLTPWNFARPTGAPYPLAYGDNFFFNQQCANDLLTWNGNTWWANRYSRMRISYVVMRFVLRPVQNALYTAPAEERGSNWPFSITYLTGRYTENGLTPENLNLLDYDDLRATKGAKTIVFSGQRSKAVTIKVKVPIRKYLGVKDLSDNEFTECLINPTMTTSDIASGTVANPAPNNAVFTYIRVSRPDNTFIPASELFTYAIQVQATAKVHFYGLQLNNPPSFTGRQPTETDDPNPGTSSSTGV